MPNPKAQLNRASLAAKPRTKRGLDYWVSGFGTSGTPKGVARVLKRGNLACRLILRPSFSSFPKTPPQIEEFRTGSQNVGQPSLNTFNLSRPVRIAIFQFHRMPDQLDRRPNITYPNWSDYKKRALGRPAPNTCPVFRRCCGKHPSIDSPCHTAGNPRYFR